MLTTVKYKGETFVINNETLKITSGAGGTPGTTVVEPQIEITQSEPNSNGEVTIKVKVTNAGDLDSIDTIKLVRTDINTEITGTVSGGEGTYVVSSNGTYKATVETTIDGAKRSGTKVATVSSIETTFSTEYGRIEVIWLDENNNIIEEPLAPDIYTGEEELTPVKWTSNGDGTVTESETTEDDTSWYKYQSIEGTDDNRTSLWANAKKYR